MNTVKLFWSGGKDSTAAAYLHHKAGDMCKVVYYIPMLNEYIPLITREHYRFITTTAVRFSAWGFEVHQAAGMTYYDHVTRVLTRGPRKGEIMGFGLGFGFCLFRNYSKVKALNSCDVGTFDYADIGIAADEVKRHGQLTEEKRSILVERGITEKEAFTLCADIGLLSPVYKLGGRDGCIICPNGNSIRLKQWAADYPEGVSILRKLETIAAGVGPGKVYRDGTVWTNIIDGR